MSHGHQRGEKSEMLKSKRMPFSPSPRDNDEEENEEVRPSDRLRDMIQVNRNQVSNPYHAIANFGHDIQSNLQEKLADMQSRGSYAQP